VAPDAIVPFSAASPVAVDLERLPWIRKLAVDYALNFPALAPFYAGDPTMRDAWTKAAARAQAHPRMRDAVADLIRAQQLRRSAPPAAVASTELLKDPASVAVVTGQQAGLFGGPLYTLLKAVMAVRLAERAARDLGIPVVPIFWIDADDHDWDEVATCTVLGEDGDPRGITLPRPEGPADLPIGRITLGQGIEATVSELAAAMGTTEFSGTLLDSLRGAYRPGLTMSEAFGQWLDATLGPLGLVVFDAVDPAAKRLAAPLFARELETAGRSSALAAEAGTELAHRGYHAQVAPSSESVALFHMDDGRRTVIQRQGDTFVIAGRSRPRAQLVAEAHDAPDRFSPNVLLRPLVQDTLFPTMCYVGGPSELAYLGQLKDVYAHFGVPMPLIYPRASVTLLDSATLRFLGKSGVAFESLQPQDEKALNDLLARELPASLDQALGAAGTAIDERMSALAAAVTEIDPTLERAALSTLGRMQHELKTLNGKIIQAAKRRDETLRRKFTRARAQSFPLGQPQERVVGFVHFLNRYGRALVDRLHAELPLEVDSHWLMTL
jgi:bacillithiol biosynthesis cysteine-adding enzyme BshC